MSGRTPWIVIVKSPAGTVIERAEFDKWNHAVDFVNLHNFDKAHEGNMVLVKAPQDIKPIALKQGKKYGCV